MRIPIGISDFQKLRESNCYYVDKTLFVEEILNASAEVLLIPRPRRFGKTLNLSMLQYFFEKSEEDRSDLFKDTLIHEKEAFGLHQGKYPVIFMSFKDIKEPSWDICLKKLANLQRSQQALE